MRQLTEEEIPYIKPPFVLKNDGDKEEARKWIVNAEADGIRPPATRNGTIFKIVGEGEDRILILDYYGIYIYILNNELTKELQEKPSKELENQKIPFKLIGKHSDKLIGSCNAIIDYYKTAMCHGKILKGKIVEVKKGKTKYGDYAIVLSKGDKIIIPASEFEVPQFLSPEEKINHIIEFVVVEIKGDRIIGSTRIVSEYRREQLDFFYDTGETFKAEVEKTGQFGAFLTYKHNNGLILRNKDFSSNYTLCKEVLEKGDTVNVSIKEVSKNTHKYVVELVNKFTVAPVLKYEDITPEQEFKGEVVEVQPFGCFVRISPGRDVLCAVSDGKREPICGDLVTVQISVVDSQNEKLRGRILKYEDNLLDLSKYNLI